MMAALSLTSSLSLVVVNVNLTSSASAAIHTKHNDSSLFAAARCTCTKPSLLLTSFRIHPKNRKLSPRRGLIVLAVTGEQEEQEEEEQSIPSWAKPDSDEPPPWARHESPQTAPTFEPPFFVYLLASAITAIAAIGSVFEYVNQRPVFGVLNSDSVFYAPLLGFFAFTGIPTSAFLWFKSVQVANKEAEEQDRRDGYL